MGGAGGSTNCCHVFFFCTSGHFGPQTERTVKVQRCCMMLADAPPPTRVFNGGGAPVVSCFTLQQGRSQLKKNPKHQAKNKKSGATNVHICCNHLRPTPMTAVPPRPPPRAANGSPGEFSRPDSCSLLVPSSAPL